MTDTAAGDAAIKLIVIDNPPVNSIGVAERRMLATEIEAAVADPAIRAVIIHGTNGRFSAGADIRQFADAAAVAEQPLTYLLRKIERSEKPVIAAMEGIALGGGLELALACHYRVARKGTIVALPEVTLGILPGAGGTQRLPRAIGFAAALDLMTSGQRVDVASPQVAGLVDEIVEDDALGAARALAARLIAEGSPVRRLSEAIIDKAEAEAALAAARERLLPNRVPSIPAVLECLDDALHLADFDQALANERARFEKLVTTPESRALRHAFFAEREVSKIPGIDKSTPVAAISTIAVIGAGTMGRGITIACLDAGYSVNIVDANEEALARGVKAIGEHYQTMVERGRLKADAAEARRARLSGTTDLAQAAAAADLVIEAVFENMDVKKDVLSRLDNAARPGTILATNTSTLDVNVLAAATARPDRVVGMHFFSPANIMKLVEVVRGSASSNETLATAMDVTLRLNKIGVVAGVCDGFIGNRMLEEYLRQAYFLLDEGALPAEVDGAMEAWGMAMGPLKTMDLAGQDIGWAIRKRRAVEQPDRPYSAIPDRVCELGRFGQKTGAGFYRYEGRKAIPDPEIDRLVEAYSAEIGITRRRISPEEIVERCLYALVNEGAKLLAEGIALRASDIDVVYLAGYGFPRYRGGPMHYANEIGLDNVIAAMRRFEQGYQGKFWEPAPLLLELAAKGEKFR